MGCGASAAVQVQEEAVLVRACGTPHGVLKLFGFVGVPNRRGCFRPVQEVPTKMAAAGHKFSRRNVANEVEAAKLLGIAPGQAMGTWASERRTVLTC